MKLVQMSGDHQDETGALTGKIGRRRVVAAIGALGGFAVAAPLAMRGTTAKGNDAPGVEHAGHFKGAVLQEGTPPVPATPALGVQLDGSTRWKVVAGAGSMEEMIDLLAFFPTNITVNTGDSILWEVRGFHNVHFLSGAPLPEAIVPDMSSGTPVSGPPQLILNPEVALPSGGTTYDGGSVVNSGLPLDPAAPPPLMTFTAPGTFDYYCTLHGETMKGTVTVQEAGAEYPMDQAAVDAAGIEEAESLLARARALLEDAIAATPGPTDGPANHHVIAGLSVPGIEVNAFIPRELRIKAGDVVQWVNEATAPPVPHTVTFLGEAETPAFIVPEPRAGGSPKLVLNPRLTAPMAPQIPDAYRGAAFANSGLLGGDPNAPLAFELLFDTPGIYRYYCAVHGDPEVGMVGDIIVEPA